MRAEFWFLPSCSLNSNPIGVAFAKLKRLLWQAAARTDEALAAAIWAGLKAITPSDANGYFTRCGYPLPAQQA
jgi:hypothetical protein